jgi:voltage-gated potassium channel
MRRDRDATPDLPPVRRVAEWFVQALIFYSLGMYFIEIEFTGADHSVGFFLWSERVVATLLTVEYLVRWITSGKLLYPFRILAIIDLLAILPFYIGFMVDLRTLRLIRSLRIVRLMKLYRYSAALQKMTRAFNRVRHEFGIVGFVVVVVIWLSTVAIYEIERDVQPERFGNLRDAFWYVMVTITTVGYGDSVPVSFGGKMVAIFTMLAGMGLFGTFISLIGGAFVEEIRAELRSKRAPAFDDPQEPLPPELLHMTRTNFDPQAVLHALDTGALSANNAAVSLLLKHLLRESCQSTLQSKMAEATARGT